MEKCIFCGEEKDLRMGACFDCAEAQNVLVCGKGMMEDEDGSEIEFPVKIVNERLKKLISLGWKKDIRKL